MKQIALFFILLLSPSLFSQNNSRKYFKEGNKNYMSKFYDEAAANYLRAIQEGENSFKTNFNLGNALFKLKKYEEAVFQYEKSINLAKNNEDLSDALFNIGDCFYKRGNYNKAAEAFKKVLKINPNDDKARYNYALAKQRLKTQTDPSEDNNDNIKNTLQNTKEKENKTPVIPNDKISDNKNKNGQSGGEGEKQSGKNKGSEIGLETSQTQGKNTQIKETYRDGGDQYYESILNSMKEQEKKTQQRIINKRLPQSKERKDKDW